MSEEPYRLILAPGTRRALTDLLPEAAAIAAWEFISGPLALIPRRVGTPLRAPFVGDWRAGRGEYRVRYEVDDATHTVRIFDIDHRRDAYRS
ncbi:MAG: type II toxin-antitoxin system RelE/ParE family toxin [Actinomycetota bacterium]|nr:type II toxin-antitoxin system RelE/ParE family toxin [Actinomycetota bacterium]